MKQLICICCPLGCALKIDDRTLEVSGNSCIRGKKYAIDEVTAPKRMVTSICKVKRGVIGVCSVKTQDAIDKKLVFDCLEEISKITLTAPIYAGDVIINNVLNTGIDVISTKTVLEENNE